MFVHTLDQLAQGLDTRIYLELYPHDLSVWLCSLCSLLHHDYDRACPPEVYENPVRGNKHYSGFIERTFNIINWGHSTCTSYFYFGQISSILKTLSVYIIYFEHDLILEGPSRSLVVYGRSYGYFQNF